MRARSNNLVVAVINLRHNSWNAIITQHGNKSCRVWLYQAVQRHKLALLRQFYGINHEKPSVVVNVADNQSNHRR